jgi:hypothetical protein
MRGQALLCIGEQPFTLDLLPFKLDDLAVDSTRSSAVEHQVRQHEGAPICHLSGGLLFCDAAPTC